MAIVNDILRTEGNRAYPAGACISVESGGMGIGSSLRLQAEMFDGKNGQSLGIQGLEVIVDANTEGYDPELLDPETGLRGGIELYQYLRRFAKVIENGWDPYVYCWASEASKTFSRLDIKPVGSDGNPNQLVGVTYQYLKITEWTFAPTPIGSV